MMTGKQLLSISKKLSILIISLQLLVLPYANTMASTCDYSDDASLKAEKDKCTSASQEWVCELNRCMTTEQAIDVRKRFKECEALTESTAKKECFQNIATEESGDLNFKDQEKGMIANTVYGMTVGLAVLSYVTKKSQSKCTSKTIMTVAAGVFLLAEIYQYFFLGKKLEKLRKEYEEKAADDSSYNAQVEAFEYLKKEQQEVKNIASQKRKVYLALTALYGAATVMAVYEMVVPAAKKCVSSGTSSPADTPKVIKTSDNFFKLYTSTDELEKPIYVDFEIITKENLSSRELFSLYIEQYYFASSQKITPNFRSIEKNELFTNREEALLAKYANVSKMFAKKIIDTIIPEAHAEMKHSEIYKKKKLTSYLPVLLGAAASAAASMYTSFGKYLSSSAGIAVISGVAAVMSYKLSAAAKEVEKQADENIKRIDEAMEKFSADAGGFCPEGRDDLSNPKCYCYTDDGEKNQSHSSSETCQNLWAEGANLNVASTGYSSNGIPEAMGCVTKDDQFDPDCDCKELINSSGDNACLKTVSASLGASNIGTASSLNTVLGEANKITGGNLAQGNLTEGTVNKLAKKNNKMNKVMLRKFNQDNKKAFKLPTNRQAEGMLKNMLTPKLINAAKSAPFAKGALSSGMLKSKGSSNKALKNALNKSGIKASYNKRKTKGKAKNKSEFSFDFGSSSQLGAKGEDLQFDKIDKNFKFDKQDINSDKGVSIWKIISKRFDQTALRRLFEEE